MTSVYTHYRFELSYFDMHGERSNIPRTFVEDVADFHNQTRLHGFTKQLSQFYVHKPLLLCTKSNYKPNPFIKQT